MEEEISQSLEEIENLKFNLERKLYSETVPSNQEMVIMYSLRSIMKEKLRKSIE